MVHALFSFRYKRFQCYIQISRKLLIITWSATKQKSVCHKPREMSSAAKEAQDVEMEEAASNESKEAPPVKDKDLLTFEGTVCFK